MAAHALDAADGVMDGRHFGRPIIQAGGPSFGGYGGFAQPAFGTAFGQQQFGTVQSFGQPAFGGAAFGQPSFIGGGVSAASSLDAADGVIDGRHFGRPIVQAGGFGQPAFGGVQYGGAQVLQGAPSFVQAPSYGAYGGQAFGGGFAQPGFGGGFAQPVQQFGGFGGAPTQFGGFQQAFGGVQSRAAQLDAADGVIDGRFYGRQIVQRR